MNRAQGYFRAAAKKGHVFAQRQIAIHLIRGGEGWVRIPLGVWVLIRAIVTGIKIHWKNEKDERVVA